MEIIIPLPHDYSINTYKELNNYLKQFELAIHYAQKSVKSAEESGLPITEDCYVNFQNEILKNSLDVDSREDKNKEFATFIGSFMDDYYEEFQNVELKINLQ